MQWETFLEKSQMKFDNLIYKSTKYVFFIFLRESIVIHTFMTRQIYINTMNMIFNVGVRIYTF